MARPELAGAVLAGGRSRRMGTDKALLTVGGVALLRRAAGVLAAAGADPVVQVGGAGRDPAQVGHIEVVPDAAAGEGPLAGVAAALGWSPHPVVAIVACDLPDLTPDVIAALVRALDDAGAQVAVARTDRIEPLCAAWRAGDTKDLVAAALRSGERAVHRVLTTLDLVEVPVPGELLRNVNVPSDVEGG